MTLRQYLFWMLLSTALCWVGCFSIVTNLDPLTAGWPGFAMFYAILILALIGTFSMLGLALRALRHPGEPLSRHAAVSFRQSLLLAAFAAGSLFLQSRSLLTWWNLLLFLATLAVAEFFLASFRTGR